MVEKQGFFTRLKNGLAKSTKSLSSGIADIFGKRKLDQAALDDLQDLLIMADLGPAVAAKVCDHLAQRKFDKDITDAEVRTALCDVVGGILEPVAKSIQINPDNRPHVILVVGVNGTGKTTTIGKIAKGLNDSGKQVMLAAGDTFRAAAIEQLEIWGERTGTSVVAGTAGGDAAAIAYEAMARAKAENIDVLLIDTAGRLQNKTGLMDELAKIVRVIGKQEASAPHDVLLVLDATTGQNALRQVEVFTEVAKVSCLAMTKLDGTARGGVLVAVAEKFGLPVHFIGIGEGVDDLQPFDAREFALALAGNAGTVH